MISALLIGAGLLAIGFVAGKCMNGSSDDLFSNMIENYPLERVFQFSALMLTGAVLVLAGIALMPGEIVREIFGP